MSVPVNLYADRMSPAQPARIADVYAVTSDRSSIYKEAASKMGLSPQEYAEFRQALADGAALYVRLPRHIESMAAVHYRSHRVYVLHNVVIPGNTMGWEVGLTDGAVVIIPQACGNLSLNRVKPVVDKPPVVVISPKQPKAVRAITYVAPPPVPVTPVVFSAPQPIAPPPVATVVSPSNPVHTSLLPFVGLLFPIAGSLPGGGGGHSASPPAVPPPCSGGSNAMGVCATGK